MALGAIRYTLATALDLRHLMQDFAGLLYERRYIGSARFDDEVANRNSYNINVFRAVLAGALYPNFVMLTERPQKHAGAIPPPIIEGRPSEGAVSIHPKSVNGFMRPIGQAWLAYFTRLKLDHGATVPALMSSLQGPTHDFSPLDGYVDFCTPAIGGWDFSFNVGTGGVVLCLALICCNTYVYNLVTLGCVYMNAEVRAVPLFCRVLVCGGSQCVGLRLLPSPVFLTQSLHRAQKSTIFDTTAIGSRPIVFFSGKVSNLKRHFCQLFYNPSVDLEMRSEPALLARKLDVGLPPLPHSIDDVSKFSVPFMWGLYQ
ncbi:unnamed protein product [Schistocephalus solidus]|uniref:OB_NTP_bind domain-containing protein n=1 Tax=Schistocephalus solidus TaxID=70667 RepID=A0A183T2X1_SCHSO|nr:unnamed protein product [Schistocephalus solidus]